jgi:hypothetical protein
VSALVALLVASAAALLPVLAAAGLAWGGGLHPASMLQDQLVRVTLFSACFFGPIGLALAPLAVRLKVGKSPAFAAFCAASAAPGVFALFGLWIAVGVPEPLTLLLAILLFYLPAPLAAMSFAWLRYRPAPKTVDGA